MIKKFSIFLVYYLLFIASPSCYAQPVSSAELINRAKEYDGRMISYEGEVIGDIMVRGGYAWLNVNDGANAIGVWLDSALLKDVSSGGSYKTKGDIIEVSGVFRRACKEHGGDLDIHAQALQKKVSGRQIIERVNPAKINLTLILAGILFIVWILQALKRR